MTNGGFIAVVVGPSGAGKDSLMDYARQHLTSADGFEFVRRVITRDGDAGGEDHDAVSEREFSRMENAGAFALHWRAHGLYYGIPASTFLALDAGKVLVVNGSRSALPAFAEVYGDKLNVVLVTAPKEVLTLRLMARGRESEESVRQRLERVVDLGGDIKADVTIVNDKTLEEGGAELVRFLKRQKALLDGFESQS